MFENGKLLYAKKTPRTVITKKPKPSPKSGTSGSGFFISKLGHVITNQHIVSDCRKVTVGDNSKKQVTATVMETDRRNDLALLRISSTKMASAETKSLISKLNIKVVPKASDGLMRSEDVELVCRPQVSPGRSAVGRTDLVFERDETGQCRRLYIAIVSVWLHRELRQSVSGHPKSGSTAGHTCPGEETNSGS